MLASIEAYRDQESMLPKIIVIYGPTASGKTDLALDIAEYLSSEIISADSRQIYRGLDIGTGKILPDEMQGIPHHMLDVIDPSQAFSMVDFANMSLPIISDLQKRGKIPILCWGTGLYIDAILYAMEYPDTPPDWAYRESLEKIRNEEGNQKLWDMLYEVDPEYASELSPGNYRYVMRGLEVIRDTGRSKRESKNTKRPRFFPFFLTPYDDSGREILYERINNRVKRMFASWLLEEVRYNMSVFNSHCPGLKTIGYKEVVEHIEGKHTLEETIALVAQHSRNYAKRQITWNKRYANSFSRYISIDEWLSSSFVRS